MSSLVLLPWLLLTSLSGGASNSTAQVTSAASTPASTPVSTSTPASTDKKPSNASHPAPTGSNGSAAGMSKMEAFPEVAPPQKVVRPLSATADHLTAFTKEHREVWKGHVHAIRTADDGQPPVHLKCDELTTFLANGEQKGEQQHIDKAVCKGNVEVVQGDRVGWGDLAVFDNDQERIVVTGHPHGQQGANTFQGDKLTFHTDDDVVDVDHVNGTFETQGQETPGQPKNKEANKDVSAKNNKNSPTPKEGKP
jgi:lipopolysaccharide export system protein LptA